MPSPTAHPPATSPTPAPGTAPPVPTHSAGDRHRDVHRKDKAWLAGRMADRARHPAHSARPATSRRDLPLRVTHQDLPG
ncbi:hypothetical protein CYR32_15580 [Chimaeribacter coloradensis]|uniref:Uncharacterized protein n=1 Tax=Chimaeribacter coloradensis TaxID=2060068 RepID=A0A2N5DXR8_9GAMM|nr:hypothetical protein CYR32_15580 [Chimaeribacter coloradensis]